MARWLKIVLPALCLTWAGASQAVVLRAAVTVPLSGTPAALALQDLNWNLIPDLVAADSSGNSVTAIANQGAPIFSPSYSYATGSSPAALALADFSGDGYGDIAVANQGSGTVSILTSRAVAGVEFNTASHHAAGSAPVAIVAGRFNSDSLNDLVVVNATADTVSLLVNGGSGTFPAVTPYAVGSSPKGLVAADFDGNGTLDLAVSNQGGNSVTLLLNDGNGVFTSAGSFGAGTAPGALALLDYDRNGTLDLAVANPSSSAISILRSDGGAGFTRVAGYSVGASPAALVAADFNGDGYDDIAVANGGSNSVSLLENGRDGTFVATLTVTVGSAPLAIAAADLDLDGDSDLMTADSGSSSLSLLFNDTDFTPGQFAFIDKGSVPFNTTLVSDPVTLSGMSGWSELSVSGGDYSVSADGGVTWSPWRSAPMVVTTGYMIRLRATSAASGGITVSVAAEVGGVSDSFDISTIADREPDPFDFTDQRGVPANSPIISNVVSVTGIDVSTTINVIGGKYRIDGGAFVSGPSQVSSNSTVELQLISSPHPGGSAGMTVVIGGVYDTFTVTTAVPAEEGGGGAPDPLLLLLPLLAFIWRRAAI